MPARDPSELPKAIQQNLASVAAILCSDPLQRSIAADDGLLT